MAAIGFAQLTDHGADQVLFSGENALAPLIQEASTWTVGALLLLVLCKGVAYTLSLASFRGGPTFPAMFIGAAGGLALSHLPGLPPIAGVAMGIGAMAVAMLRLPLTSVLLTGVFLQADSVELMPLIIVSVVVAHVATARLAPRRPGPGTGTGTHRHRRTGSGAQLITTRGRRTAPADPGPARRHGDASVWALPHGHGSAAEEVRRPTRRARSEDQVPTGAWVRPASPRMAVS